MSIGSVLVAVYPLVCAKGLVFHESQGAFIDVGAQKIPAGSKSGLAEANRTLSVGDQAVNMADDEVTGGLHSCGGCA